MNRNEVEIIYNNRIFKFKMEVANLNKRSKIFISLKFSILFLFFYQIFQKHLNFIFLIVVVVSFIIVVFFHEKNIKKQKFSESLFKINKDELFFMNFHFPSLDNGKGFYDEDHRYAKDLNIFGEKSLFHYINRCLTSSGKNCLASWLKEPSAIGELQKRQDAISELKEKLDFRHKILFYGLRHDVSKKTDDISNFFYSILGRKKMIAFFHLFPVVTVSAFILIFFHFPWHIFLSAVIVQMLTNLIFNNNVAEAYLKQSENGKILNSYTDIIAEVEIQSFKSVELCCLQSELHFKGHLASVYIKRLSNLLGFFDLIRNSVFHLILNNTLFWDFHCLYRIEKWHNEAGMELQKWFNIVGKIEALCSLANLYFNHPEWTMPEFHISGFRMESISIGHPLIHENERIYNDILIQEKGSLVLITGPNMAGKSTFLRTVGVNMVLALAGSPVCAKKFSIPLINLYSSMNVTDSLDNKLSLFYKELMNIKKIWDATLRKEPVFFIIDEMLKGTNTTDRVYGAIALINQLIYQEANGIIATHELELTKLEENSQGHLVNYYFDSRVKDDKLIFDYKLKKGICQSSNALTLMRGIGIDLQ